MSLHKSLKSKNKLLRARNVLSREERIEHLKQEERWSEEQSIFGLPKVRVQTKARRREKVAKEEPEATAAEPGAAEAPPESAAQSGTEQ